MAGEHVRALPGIPVGRFGPDDPIPVPLGLEKEAFAGCRVAIVGGDQGPVIDPVTQGLELAQETPEILALACLNGLAFGVERSPLREFWHIFHKEHIHVSDLEPAINHFIGVAALLVLAGLAAPGPGVVDARWAGPQEVNVLHAEGGSGDLGDVLLMHMNPREINSMGGHG